MKAILIVEDDIHNLKMLCDILGLNGFKVISAQSIEESQALLEQCLQLDLLLLDLNLPDGLGFSLVAPIRSQFADLPIILMTASDTPENIAQAKEMGINLILGKPFHPKQMLTEVQSLLGN